MKSIPLGYCIETERLVLRRAIDEEIEFVWEATRYPGFNDGMMWNRPESREELSDFSGNIEGRWRNGEAFLFTYREKVTNCPVGRIVIERRFSEWNCGFWTHPKWQGAGYATEALAGVTNFVFEELEAKVVNASHAEWNVASRTVLERNGFRFKLHLDEGFEREGDWVALDKLSLTRDQWLKSKT